MRFYTQQHRHDCGVDLHARTLYLCMLDQAGKVLLHRNLPCERERFLRAVAPYREDLAVAVECLFCWYWLADLCAEEGIAFVLGHALFMKAVHGGRSKNLPVDSYKIATLLRGGTLPQAYVYPRQWRPTRDLLRFQHPKLGGRLGRSAPPPSPRSNWFRKRLRPQPRTALLNGTA